jgi:NAD(P)H-hydrate epimerase
LVLCGPGNNGGDGFVAARLLADGGWPVGIGFLGAETALRGDAAVNRQRWHGKLEPLSPDLLAGEPLVIDALFGAGLARPIEGVAREIIDRINARDLDCVGIDVPSGVHGDTGKVLGTAPRCRITVTFFRAKPGHFLLPGRDLCGRLEIADIGIPTAVLAAIAPGTSANGPSLWRAALPLPTAAGNKYTRGHCLIAGGPMTGATRLAAEAARRIGAGLVTIAADAETHAIYASGRPGTIVARADDAAALARLIGDRRLTTFLIGPGAGVDARTQDRVLAMLGSGKPCVLDADAITVFRGDPERLFAAIVGASVMTPHEGEFQRIFSVSGDKLHRAREAARSSGATVLIKGSDTVVAAPDGRAAINSGASAYLATGGSGDVLAGMIAGLLAQGADAFTAACAASWLHGQIADGFGAGLIAEDLIDGIPAALAAVLGGRAGVAKDAGGRVRHSNCRRDEQFR